MLVLKRKSKESVVVGGADRREHMLKITVLAVHGDHVRLGFEGPVQVSVLRLELWERIRHSAAHTDSPERAAALRP